VGVFLYESACTVSDNTIRGSAAGALYCSDSNLLITNNEFSNNTAESGAALLCVDSTIMVIDNLMTSNIATKHNGGALWADTCDVTIENCIIRGNQAVYGGAIRVDESPLALINNLIVENTADHGGAIWCYGDYPQSPVTMINNTFADNFANFQGGSIYCYRYIDFLIVNSTFWSKNSFPDRQIMLGASSMLDISYSVMKDGMDGISVYPGSTLTWGPGMKADHPGFIDPMEGDFHIPFTSPCRDAGYNAAPGLPVEDFEGDARITYESVDIGADEHAKHLYGLGDLTPGGFVRLKVTDLPGTGPVLLWMGSGIMDPPKSTIYGDWYLLPPLLLTVPLGSVPADGVISIFSHLPPDLPAPVNVPLQALAGSGLTNLFELKIE
jgi:parallel beta-helix repeat protein